MATCIFALVAGISTCVTLDPSLTIASGVLKAVVPAPAVLRVPQLDTWATSAPATLTLRYVPQPGSLLVFRNGLLMASPLDYSLSLVGGAYTIGFVPAQAWQPGDVVSAFYWH